MGQGAGKGTRFMTGAESGSDLGGGEPWLLLALLGHTLTLYEQVKLYSIKMIARNVTRACL